MHSTNTCTGAETRLLGQSIGTLACKRGEDTVEQALVDRQHDLRQVQRRNKLDSGRANHRVHVLTRKQDHSYSGRGVLVKYWRIKIRWTVWNWLADFYIDLRAQIFSKGLWFSISSPDWLMNLFDSTDEELEFLDSIDFPGC